MMNMEKTACKEIVVAEIADNPTSDIALTHPFKDILPDMMRTMAHDNRIGIYDYSWSRSESWSHSWSW